MEKLQVVKFLIDEIEEEQKLLKEYKETEKQAREKYNNEDRTRGWWSYFKWSKRKPCKSRIKNNAKKARQLLLEISKED
jgi:hypothetical protein